MKSISKLFGIIALVAIIGFLTAACDDGSGGGNGDGDQPLPAAVGKNEVGGETYYYMDTGSSHRMEKIEFSASASTYTHYTIRFANGGIDRDADGKYKWYIMGTGIYTWNWDAKTVTLKMEKFYAENYYYDNDNDYDVKGLDKAGYKALLTAQLNDMIKHMKEEQGMTQAQIDAYIKERLANMGYSSVSQYIDAMANERFGNRPQTYSFSNDGKSLFMKPALPEPKGTDELAGKTYYGETLHYSGYVYEYEFDENPTIFKVGEHELYLDKPYFVASYESGYSYKPIVGSYSYDSTRKRVYFSIEFVGLKTPAEYYETLTNDSLYGYINDDAYKAAMTNSVFRPGVFYDDFYYFSYDPVEKLINRYWWYW